jgi:hypothetical protein
MTSFTRRFMIAAVSFVLAWTAAAFVATWLFGSGNVLVWVTAAIVGLTAYVAVSVREGPPGRATRALSSPFRCGKRAGRRP